VGGTLIVLCAFAILPFAACVTAPVLTQQKAAEAAYSDRIWRALPGLDDGKLDPLRVGRLTAVRH